MKQITGRNGLTILLAAFLILIPAFARAQTGEIRGQILDETRTPVTGAFVVDKADHANGTMADIDGKFTLRGGIGTVLQITSLGFETLEVKIGRLTDNVFILKEDRMVLNEVVVVGMDTQKRNTITAAVANLKEEDFATRAVTDITSALQGNIAGLNFSSDAVGGGVGGETGADITFTIRGTGSINGGPPYILVDGVEQSLQNVNAADIASISVLKDASASAVYGARAAYGVVLVTTKSGSRGRANVTYRGTAGFSSPIRMPEMMHSLDFALYNNERFDNGGAGSGGGRFSPLTIEKIKGFMNAPYSKEFPGVEPDSTGERWAGMYYSQYADTDWFKYYFKDAAPRQSHSLSLSGGTETVRYYAGLGYTRQGGLLDRVKDALDKYTLQTKLSVTPKKWLKADLNNSMTLQTIDRPLASQMILYNTIGSHLPTMATELPVESEEYRIPGWNQMLYLKSSHFRNNRLSDAVSGEITVTPLRGWDIQAGVKGRIDILANSLVMDGNPKYQAPNGNLLYGTAAGQKQGYAYPEISWKNMYFGSYTRGSALNWYLSPQVSTSYKNQWGRHFFKGMIGCQMEVQHNSREYLYKDHMLSEDIFSFKNAAGNVIAGEDRSHWSTMGCYAKFNYNYHEVYFVEVSGRYDGSSRFAPGHRWGLFPSFSLGYDIAREEYFRNLGVPVSQLKLRLSYGRLGNQSGAGLYDYLAQIPLDAQGTDGWLLPGVNSPLPEKGTLAGVPRMISPCITWEKVDNANLGLDFMAFKDRLMFTTDIYQRTTHDMIGPAEAIPDISGIAPNARTKVNNATLRNRGWEMSVSWNDRLRCGFSYGIGFNVFNYKAVVTKYNNPEGLINNNHTGLPANKGYYVGMDLGEIWGYHADDLFMGNREIDAYLAEVDLSYFKPDDMWRRGDVKFLDHNGDGKVDGGKGTLSDHGDLDIIGNATPKYSFGLNLDLGYKSFRISALFQGVGRRDFPISGSNYMFGGNNYNFKQHLDHFSNANPNGYLPRLTGWKDDKNFMVNTGYNTTRYLLDASYVRLKNLTIACNINPKLLKKIHTEKLKLYLTFDNLFTFTRLPKQFDPETLNQVNWMAGGDVRNRAPGLTSPMKQNGNGMVYPLNRTFVFGLDFTF